ncbi:hypothetical protein SSP24_58410 [Streptomyces spinoverrucosus]|uniref:Uncharacterized protein n=1 Tax=Streptomyces spinoverrucosus TaxID=284043 RepID=A0A4Y3VT92_9ACTN|nr:hypothetical protein [Streptomyces spinoverrucosus]GEC08186.1 hypothetical protein SSP24_58410 [Streptomyces spinoverrucosus]GHB62994.1 hypothetical protein GCM10010397_36320 [Streptomyces spinoverrucosus]
MDFDAVADELYRLRPEHFTTARDTHAAAARKAGDRALAEKIGKLRRPSLSAWASNLLVREQPDQVEPLLRLGEGLRQAHHDLDGAQLRELIRQQRVLISALSRQAGQLAAQAGRPITPEAQREVESTLQAVLADPDAAEHWAAGRLVKPLDAAVGFPAIAQDAVRRAPAVSAAPPPAARRESAADETRRERLAKAREEAESAESELRAAEEEATAAAHDAEGAKKQADQLRQRVGSLAEELERAEEEHRQAVAAERQARERARFVDRRVTEARRRAKAAAARVKRLTTGSR